MTGPPGQETGLRVEVSGRGAARWAAGHPWIYRSDLRREPERPVPGVARVEAGGEFVGQALYSPASKIRLRLLDRSDRPIDAGWWAMRIREAADRRRKISGSAYRVVHGEADALPSLIVDRYGRFVVAQLLTAGLEACREDVLTGIRESLEPAGILLRNDAPIRRHEELPLRVELAFGDVPHAVEVEEEAGIHYRIDPWKGQKTGAFLDQRQNRALAGRLARGRSLDLFCYEGGFALHLARNAERVLAVDQSGEALIRARENAELNGIDNVVWEEGNAFDRLRRLDDAAERFDVIVLDPPAFAKSKAHIERALSGYREINRRAVRLLAPGGHLLSFSCSYHVDRSRFLEMLRDAAAESGRRLALRELLGPSADHPEIVTIPETGYLKGALLQAL